jgi:anthranilate phosphoribosyltransferase
MDQFLEKLRNKINLNFDESKNAFKILMNGEASDQQIYDFLTLLSDKGEVSDEIAGGVYILRDKSKRVKVENCIDTCGTGGDGKDTLNISTASALLLASMGIKVAKHGNKAVSSKCGSADVLEALNININLEPKQIEEQIKNDNFGVFDNKLLKIFANALKNLNLKFAWIVNSEDGLDEISPYAKTNIVQLKNNEISEFIIDPDELNINADKFENLIGDDAKFNSDKILNIFEGEDNDFSKAVCLNAAAGLMISEKYDDFKIAYNYTRGFIKSGAAFKYIKSLQNV